MTVWYVHRRADNTIASAYQNPQPDYATEALDDATSAELQAYLAIATALPDPSLADNQVKALKAVLLASAAMSGKTVAQAKAAFTTAWNALP